MSETKKFLSKFLFGVFMIMTFGFLIMCLPDQLELLGYNGLVKYMVPIIFMLVELFITVYVEVYKKYFKSDFIDTKNFYIGLIYQVLSFVFEKRSVVLIEKGEKSRVISQEFAKKAKKLDPNKNN